MTSIHAAASGKRLSGVTTLLCRHTGGDTLNGGQIPSDDLPGLSDLEQVGVSSVQRSALAAPGTIQRDPHWRAWISSSLPSWSPGFSCWSQPRGCSRGKGHRRRGAGLRGPPAALRRLSTKRSRHIRGYRWFECARGSGPQSDGADTAPLPLSMRNVSLARLLARRVDDIFLSDFEQDEIGPDLFRHAA
jgi:hypothetical protein